MKLGLATNSKEFDPRSAPRDLVVMSNRTPTSERGRAREVGGLVSALEPALRDRDGIWIGWSGETRPRATRLTVNTEEQPARATFDMTPEWRQQFYGGFCNRTLWPLFHGFRSRVQYSDADWDTYVRANDTYARHALELASLDAVIWVHDYHLLLTAQALRRLGHRGPIGLFLHVPFPSHEMLETMPWATELLHAMLEFDLLGFHTDLWAENFYSAVRGMRKVTCEPGLVRCGERITTVRVFPLPIDAAAFAVEIEETAEIAGLREQLGDKRLLLGVDRLDYSKGIPERLDAYERMLDRTPEWRGKVTLVQVAVPSRSELPDYVELRSRIESMVGRINGKYGEANWVPIRYLYRSYDHQVLTQLYRMADVALVTPLRDGMNLVAKEFVAAQDSERPGVLVLSQYAGAAAELTAAVLTNPFHPEGLASDIEIALRMPAGERMQRHRALSAVVTGAGTPASWAAEYLDCLTRARARAQRPTTGSSA